MEEAKDDNNIVNNVDDGNNNVNDGTNTDEDNESNEAGNGAWYFGAQEANGVGNEGQNNDEAVHDGAVLSMGNEGQDNDEAVHDGAVLSMGNGGQNNDGANNGNAAGGNDQDTLYGVGNNNGNCTSVVYDSLNQFARDLFHGNATGNNTNVCALLQGTTQGTESTVSGLYITEYAYGPLAGQPFIAKIEVPNQMTYYSWLAQVYKLKSDAVTALNEDSELFKIATLAEISNFRGAWGEQMVPPDIQETAVEMVRQMRADHQAQAERRARAARNERKEGN